MRFSLVRILAQFLKKVVTDTMGMLTEAKQEKFDPACYREKVFKEGATFRSFVSSCFPNNK